MDFEMENNNTLKEVIIVKWSTGPIMRRFQLKKSEWSYSNMLDKIHLLQPGFNDILHYSDGVDNIAFLTDEEMNAMLAFFESQPAYNNTVYIKSHNGDGNEQESVEDENLRAASLPTHTNIICDHCNMEHICGTRYKCMICPDFDLCGKCEKNGIHSEHIMVRIMAPEMMKQYAEKMGNNNGRSAEICPGISFYSPITRFTQIPPHPSKSHHYRRHFGEPNGSKPPGYNTPFTVENLSQLTDRCQKLNEEARNACERMFAKQQGKIQKIQAKNEKRLNKMVARQERRETTRHQSNAGKNMGADMYYKVQPHNSMSEKKRTVETKRDAMASARSDRYNNRLECLKNSAIEVQKALKTFGIECDATIEDDEGKVHCSIPPVTKSQMPLKDSLHGLENEGTNGIKQRVSEFAGPTQEKIQGKEQQKTPLGCGEKSNEFGQPQPKAEQNQSTDPCHSQSQPQDLFTAAILSAQKGLQVLQNLNFAKLLDLDPQAVNAAQNFGTEMGNRIGSALNELHSNVNQLSNISTELSSQLNLSGAGGDNNRATEEIVREIVNSVSQFLNNGNVIAVPLSNPKSANSTEDSTINQHPNETKAMDGKEDGSKTINGTKTEEPIKTDESEAKSLERTFSEMNLVDVGVQKMEDVTKSTSSSSSNATNCKRKHKDDEVTGEIIDNNEEVETSRRLSSLSSDSDISFTNEDGELSSSSGPDDEWMVVNKQSYKELCDFYEKRRKVEVDVEDSVTSKSNSNVGVVEGNKGECSNSFVPTEEIVEIGVEDIIEQQPNEQEKLNNKPSAPPLPTLEASKSLYDYWVARALQSVQPLPHSGGNGINNVLSHPKQNLNESEIAHVETNQMPMTFDEKRQLSMRINNLPVDRLANVVRIIESSHEQFPNLEEIEIDFERLRPSTLRALEAYVNTCFEANVDSTNETDHMEARDSATTGGLYPVLKKHASDENSECMAGIPYKNLKKPVPHTRDCPFMHHDPKIQSVVDTLVFSMGYDNCNGWLTRLAEQCKGDISRILDAAGKDPLYLARIAA